MAILNNSLQTSTHLNFIGQGHVNHLTERITDICEDFMNGFLHGLEEVFILSVEASNSVISNRMHTGSVDFHYNG